jgi:hypothetical protein
MHGCKIGSNVLSCMPNRTDGILLVSVTELTDRQIELTDRPAYQCAELREQLLGSRQRRRPSQQHSTRGALQQRQRVFRALGLRALADRQTDG